MPIVQLTQLSGTGKMPVIVLPASAAPAVLAYVRAIQRNQHPAGVMKSETADAQTSAAS